MRLHDDLALRVQVAEKRQIEGKIPHGVVLGVSFIPKINRAARNDQVVQGKNHRT